MSLNRDELQAATDSRLRAAHALRTKLTELGDKEASEEDNAQLDRMNAEYSRWKQIETSLLDDAQREVENATANEAIAAITRPAPHAGRAMSQFEKWIRGDASASNSDDGRDAFVVDVTASARMFDQIRQGADAREVRASILSDTGSSGSVIPTEMANTLYQYMVYSSAVRQVARVITTSDGANIDFPRVNAHGIGTQVIAQGTAIGGTDATFEKMTLGAYKYGQLVDLSNELIQDSAVDITGFVAENIGRALGILTATEYTTGDGSGNPNGVITAAAGAGSIVTGGSLITVTPTDLISLMHAVPDSYRKSPSFAFIMNDLTIGSLRKYRDSTGGTLGAYLWAPNVVAGQPDTFNGVKVLGETNVATHGSSAKVVACGDFSAYYIRDAGPVRIERSDQFRFDKDLTSYRGVVRTDADLIDTNAVKVIHQVVA